MGFSVMLALAEAEDIEIILRGGTLRYISYGVVGPYAELVLRRITADKTFVSADGVVAGRGLCQATAEQAALKALMLAQAREVYILADSTKLGDSYSSFWTPFPEKWTLLTDSNATEAQLSPFRSRPGVQIQNRSNQRGLPSFLDLVKRQEILVDRVIQRGAHAALRAIACAAFKSIEQFREPRLVEFTHLGLTVQTDPFRMLDAKCVVDHFLQLRVRGNRVVLHSS